MSLNPKQQRFVAEYLIDNNATQAAIRSGYSEKTAGQIGARLLKNVDISMAVGKGVEKALKRCEVTLDTIVDDLTQDRTLAHSEGQAGAAVSATIAKAKLFGLMREKVEHSGTVTQALPDLSKLSVTELKSFRKLIEKTKG